MIIDTKEIRARAEAAKDFEQILDSSIVRGYEAEFEFGHHARPDVLALLDALGETRLALDVALERIAQIGKAVELLRSLEWSGSEYITDCACPSCRAPMKPNGSRAPDGPHEPDCKLAALLAR
jgi:hypothetical protein